MRYKEAEKALMDLAEGTEGQDYFPVGEGGRAVKLSRLLEEYPGFGLYYASRGTAKDEKASRLASYGRSIDSLYDTLRAYALSEAGTDTPTVMNPEKPSDMVDFNELREKYGLPPKRHDFTLPDWKILITYDLVDFLQSQLPLGVGGPKGATSSGPAKPRSDEANEFVAALNSLKKVKNKEVQEFISLYESDRIRNKLKLPKLD